MSCCKVSCSGLGSYIRGMLSPYNFIKKETYFIRNLICMLREAKKMFVRSSPGSREEALCSEHIYLALCRK